MRRVYHHYSKWEEIGAGMWATVSASDRPSMLTRAIEFTGDHVLYGSWMMRVIAEWPMSCEHNLSDISQNRRAWVGHAAVCLAIGIPEDVVREAWGHLTDGQRRLANLQADKAIETWERNKYNTCRSGQLELMF